MNNMTIKDNSQAPVRTADIIREYGPFPGADLIHGVTHDGSRVWAATGPKLIAFDPASGEATHAIELTCDAGTAFDGTYLYQIAQTRIDKIDPATGDVLRFGKWQCAVASRVWEHDGTMPVLRLYLTRLQRRSDTVLN